VDINLLRARWENQRYDRHVYLARKFGLIGVLWEKYSSRDLQRLAKALAVV
jgi:hypothetical protein